VAKEGVMQKMIGDKEYSPIGKERRLVGVDAEKERNRAAREQETQEAQQRRRKQHGPERQKRSKAAHSQENQKAQQERG